MVDWETPYDYVLDGVVYVCQGGSVGFGTSGFMDTDEVALWEWNCMTGQTRGQAPLDAYQEGDMLTYWWYRDGELVGTTSSEWWEEPMNITFGGGGAHTVSVSVGDTNPETGAYVGWHWSCKPAGSTCECGDPPVELSKAQDGNVTAEQQVVAVALDHFEASPAYALSGANQFAAKLGEAGGYVTVTAVLNPPVSLPAGWVSWEYMNPNPVGEPVPGDPMSWRLPSDVAGTYTVSCSILGCGGGSVTVYVCEIESLTVQSGGCLVAAGLAAAEMVPGDQDGVIVKAHLNPQLPDTVPVGLIEWSGGTPTGEPDTRRVKKTHWGKFLVQARCGASGKEMNVWIIYLNLEHLEGPPLINSDDDNCNAQEDRAQLSGAVVGENDLRKWELCLRPKGIAGSLSVQLDTQPEDVQLWREREKVVALPRTWDVAEVEPPDFFYLEGLHLTDPPGLHVLRVTFTLGACLNLQRADGYQVLPRMGDSESWFQLYRLENGEYVPVDSPVGDDVYVGLHVKAAPGERLVQDQSSATARVKEESDLHTDPENRVDLSYFLWDAASWQKKVSACGQDPVWDDEAYESPLTDNSEGAEPQEYRCLIPWHTATQPLGHNEIHSVSLHAVNGDDQRTQLQFEEWPYHQPPTPYESGPAATGATAQNVTLRNVSVSNGTIDYFKWDPDGPEALQQPVISFDIDDAHPQNYQWILWFRKTAGEGTWEGEYWAVSGTHAGAGNVQVNLADEQLAGHLDPEVHEWGTYTFDLCVAKYEGDTPPEVYWQVDHYILKAPYCLWVPVTAPDGRAGHDVWFRTPDDGPTELRCRYYLNDQSEVDADEVALVAFDPDLQERAVVSGPTQQGEVHEGTDEDGDGTADGIEVCTRSDDDPGWVWRVVFTANDGDGAEDRRTHDNPRMLAANKRAGMLASTFCLGNPGTSTPARSVFEDIVRNGMQGAGYAHNTLNNPRDAYVFMREWLGYRSATDAASPETQDPRPDRLYDVLHFFGHGNQDAIRVGAYQPRGVGRVPDPTKITEGLDRWQPDIPSGYHFRLAHLITCETAKGGPNLAWYLVGQFSTTVAIGFTGKVHIGPSDSGDWPAEVWASCFLGAAAVRPPTTVAGGVAYAKNYFLTTPGAATNSPDDPWHRLAYPDLHWGYTTASFYGNGDLVLPTYSY